MQISSASSCFLLLGLNILPKRRSQILSIGVLTRDERLKFHTRTKQQIKLQLCIQCFYYISSQSEAIEGWESTLHTDPAWKVAIHLLN
jgi:hypothetical protein